MSSIEWTYLSSIINTKNHYYLIFVREKKFCVSFYFNWNDSNIIFQIFFSNFIIRNRLRFPALQILLRTSNNKNIIALSKSKYSQNNHFSSDYNCSIISCKSSFIWQFSFLLRFIVCFLYYLKQYLSVKLRRIIILFLSER
jgi:hypothetical protein